MDKFLRRLNHLAGTMNEVVRDKPRRGDWVAIVSGPGGATALHPVAQGTRKTDFIRANPEVRFIAIVQVMDA